MFGNDRTLADDTKLEEYFCCDVRRGALAFWDAPYGVSGVVGAFVKDTKLEGNSCCGVGTCVWPGKSIPRDSIQETPLHGRGIYGPIFPGLPPPDVVTPKSTV